MNLIYIHTHDSGRFIEPYGYQIPTPNLMKLAQEGTLFRQMYCAAPTCSPSRAAMLTGTTAHACGITGLVHRGFALEDNSKHLAYYLRESGFDTVLCGVQHETSGNPKDLGYHHVFTNHVYDDTDFENIDKSSTANAIKYLKSDRKTPFFLSIGFVNTHRDFPVVENPTSPRYISVPPTLPDCQETRMDFARYIDSVKIVDNCCKLLFDTLTEENLWQDTIVFFTTDHGIAFPKMKCSLTDGGIGVSFILKYPGGKNPGRVCDTLLSQLDIYPTICDLLDLDKPEWLEGYSILPILNEEQEQVRHEVFSEVNYHAAYEPMRCVRTTKYKLIQRFDSYEKEIFCNIDDSPSKDVLLQHNWGELSCESTMLFDLVHDPMEQKNLFGIPGYETIAGELKEKLNDWMVQTNDPLLYGKVKKPVGARINTQNCLSNREHVYE